MRIGIDANLATSRHGGVGTYTVNIISSLLQSGSDQIIAFLPRGAEIHTELKRSAPGLHLDVVDVDQDAFADFFSWREHWEQVVLADRLSRYSPDVFFGPVFMFPLQWKGPTVVAVHDLIFERYPYYNFGDSNRYYRAWAKRCADSADAIITDSQYTAAEIREVWGLRQKPMKVVHLAPALEFVPDRGLSKSVVARELGVTKPYILYVGGAGPRKNVGRLVQAYCSLEASVRRHFALVLVGSHEDTLRRIASDGCRQESVIVVNYCPSRLLPYVYASAEVFVYPSFVEGFGLPPLEAMACGTPVITSNGGAIPEIVEQNALLVDPADADGIGSAMSRLLGDEQLREDFTRRGLEHAKRYSWSKTATETRSLLTSVVQNRSVTGG